MSLEVIIGEIQKRAAGLAPLEASLKIILGDQIVYIDGTGDTNVVSTKDEEADCTISTSMENFLALQSGELNAMQAVMEGEITIEGDMMIAMQLQGLM